MEYFGNKLKNSANFALDETGNRRKKNTAEEWFKFPWKIYHFISHAYSETINPRCLIIPTAKNKRRA